MMRILITGGCGFIGSHLCKQFIAEGHSVCCVDNFITGSRDNVKELLDNQRFRLIEHDISVPLYVDEPIDSVFHLASIASPKHYFAYPIKTLKSGLLGTYNCLGIAKAKNARFFLASTSEVYGDPLVHPQPEEYWGNVNTIGPRACYDESKRAAEALTYAYMRQHGLKVRVARIFNTYGPFMHPDDGRVVSNFIVQALRGEPLSLHGKGDQTRSFCYIDDLLGGIVRLMNSDYELPVNLGNPAEFSIAELARLVLELTRSRSPIEHLQALQDDPRRRCPVIEKARTILGWTPAISLEQGLVKTIAYFAQRPL